MGVDANSRKILTGLILIIAVLIPNVNKQLLDKIKLKFLYANNKNIEAINIKTAEEVKQLKQLIADTQKDASLTDADKKAKVEKYQEKIASLQKKCQEQTAALKKELKEDAAKAKEKFDKK